MLGLEFNISVGLLFVCWVVTSSLWPHGLQHTRLPCPSLSPRVCSKSCPLSQWCRPTISASIAPSPSALSLPSIRVFSSDWLFSSGGQSIGASASVLPRNIRVDFFQDWLVWSLCNPRDSQESSPELQFKTINSSVLSLLYGSALISVSNSWKTIALTILTLSAECYLCFLVCCLGLS